MPSDRAQRPRTRFVVAPLLTLVVITAADQATKILAESRLPFQVVGPGERDYVATAVPLAALGDGVTASLQYFRNVGIAWGRLTELEASQRLPVFSGIAALSIIFATLLVTVLKQRPLSAFVAAAAIAAGAVGNLIDRMRLGYVIDFVRLDFSFGRPYTFPIFNLADVAIAAGALALSLMVVRQTFGRRNGGRPIHP